VVADNIEIGILRITLSYRFCNPNTFFESELLTSKLMKTAGWLAMASAFLTLPIVYLSFRLEGMTDSSGEIIQTFIQAGGTLLFLAIILCLKKLLNAVFNFHDTDTNIALMVMASMVTGVLTIGIFSFPTLKESLQSAVIVVLVAMGIVQAQFGYRLLRLSNNLGGLLRPFCYANMATGVFLASVVLIPLSIIASALSDLMLGTIFFNLSRLMNSDDSNQR